MVSYNSIKFPYVGWGGNAGANILKYVELRLKNLVWYLLVGQVLYFLVAVLQNFLLLLKSLC